MNLQPRVGLKYGFLNACLFPPISGINNYFRGEAFDVDEMIAGSIFVFMFFGLIFTFTDKIGSDFGG